MQSSGQGRQMLAAPSGPEDATLGIILHIQREDDSIGEFWNDTNATIKLLNEKGLNKNFVFRYDWHWRGDFVFSSRSGCPAGNGKGT